MCAHANQRVVLWTEHFSWDPCDCCDPPEQLQAELQPFSISYTNLSTSKGCQLYSMCAADR